MRPRLCRERERVRVRARARVQLQSAIGGGRGRSLCPSRSRVMEALRGFKVTDAERKVRVGIAAKTLSDLKRKTVAKWKLDARPEDVVLQLGDGTLVSSEEYFAQLEPQSLLVWSREGQVAQTDAELLYKSIREVNDEFLTAGERVREFFTENMKTKVRQLAAALRTIDASKATLSHRHDHPEWFEGLDTGAQTKEEYMFRRSQDRIRTYYYRTRDELSARVRTTGGSGGDRIVVLQMLLQALQKKLRAHRYNGGYLDRSATGERLCDAGGEFVCGGRWDRERCTYAPPHAINPYASREERIVFGTWNLDHRIERTRSIVPAIVYLLRTFCEETTSARLNIIHKYVDVDTIYAHLFTTENLKLVHIVCHDKGAHLSAALPPDAYNAA